MHLLSRPRRPRRSGDWTPDRAVTFIVTLAATRSVTLAARAAGMSRKSAYALKSREPAFAAAWMAAMNAAAKHSRLAVRNSPQGNKVEEMEGPVFRPGQGNASPWRIERDLAFNTLLASLRESPFAAGSVP